MIIKLKHEERLDYQVGSKVLRSASKRAVIERSALCYLTSSLIALIDREVTMEGDEHQILDDALGLIMQLTEGDTKNIPSHYQETRL